MGTTYQRKTIEPSTDIRQGKVGTPRGRLLAAHCELFIIGPLTKEDIARKDHCR